MSITSEQRAGLRQEFEGTPRRPPVDLKVFRELLRRAPQDTWLAMARSVPIGSALDAFAAPLAGRSDITFGLYLVDSTAAGVEVLGKVRGGPRSWTNLDSLSGFVESLLDATNRKGRIRVHVV